MLSRYDNYIKFLDSDRSKKYNEALHIFFNNNPNQLCPTCNRGSVIKTVNDQGIIFMHCSDPKCNWNMQIERAQYINLYNELNIKNKDRRELGYQLITTTDKFTEIKKKYLDDKQTINEINDIFKSQKEELDKEDSKKFEIFSKVMEIYYKRKHIFANIKNSINANNRNKLLEIYKNEKNISDQRIKQISKQINVDENDIKNILLWFSLGFETIKLQKQLNEIDKDIKKYKTNMNFVNDNMMIKLPIIETKLKEIKEKKEKIEKIEVEPKKEEFKTIMIDSKALETKDESMEPTSKKIRIKRSTVPSSGIKKKINV